MTSIPLSLDPHTRLTIHDLANVASGHQVVAISEPAKQAILACETFLNECIANRRLIYGITTGFGPLATVHLSPDQAETHQRHLIYHLATGVGDPFPGRIVKGMMMTRLACLCRGYSGVSLTVVEKLCQAMNANFLPVVPSLGTVGASGDLTPLAHLVLGLMGEAPIQWKGVSQSPEVAFAESGLEPLHLGGKDGLSLVNGTAAMTAIAGLAAVDTTRILEILQSLSFAVAEILGAKDESFNRDLARVRGHQGQVDVAESMTDWKKNRSRLVSQAAMSVEGENTVSAGQPILQDAYTLRCMPQLFGALWDSMAQIQVTLEQELNGVSDNPVFLPQEKRVIHGGNFNGFHVTLAADQLSNVLQMAAGYTERLFYRLTNPNLNQGLPAFLFQGTPGLNSGMMGAQVTSTAILAEIRRQAWPLSASNISTNMDNQDVVSLGTISAWRTYQILQPFSQLVAILGIGVAQAVEIRGGTDAGFSDSTMQLVREIRHNTDPITIDRPLYEDIQRVAQWVIHGNWG